MDSMGRPVELIDVKYPAPRILPADATAQWATIGASAGYLMAVPSIPIYFESPLSRQLNVQRDIILAIAWVPSGSEAGKNVKWQLDVTYNAPGRNLSVIDSTFTVETALNPNAGIYQNAAVAIPKATLLPFIQGAQPPDELHILLTRIAASANDPVSPPGFHHLAVIQGILLK